MTVCQQSRAAAALSGNGRRSLQQALPLSENEKQSSSSRPSRRPPPPPSRRRRRRVVYQWPRLGRWRPPTGCTQIPLAFSRGAFGD